MIVFDAHPWVRTAVVHSMIPIGLLNGWEVGTLTRKGRLTLDRDVLLEVKPAGRTDKAKPVLSPVPRISDSPV